MIVQNNLLSQIKRERERQREREKPTQSRLWSTQIRETISSFILTDSFHCSKCTPKHHKFNTKTNPTLKDNTSDSTYRNVCTYIQLHRENLLNHWRFGIHSICVLLFFTPETPHPTAHTHTQKLSSPSVSSSTCHSHKWHACSKLLLIDYYIAASQQYAYYVQV